MIKAIIIIICLIIAAAAFCTAAKIGDGDIVNYGYKNDQ